jgi:hypothetical protein
MENKVFCGNCGNACDKNSAYCPQCGISVIELPKFSYSPQHHDHCISCGTKMTATDAYCSSCGQESIGYSIGDDSAIRLDSLTSVIKNKNVGETFKQIPISNFVNVERMKKADFWIPSAIFAVTSIVVGVIICLILNIVIRNATDDFFTDLINEMVRDLTGTSLANYMDLGDLGINIGALTIWLLTCLGGLTFNIRGSVDGSMGGWFGGSFSGEAAVRGNLFLGLVILCAIPVVSLVIGNLVKNVYIKDKPEYNKDSKISSAVLGSLLFTVLNVILMLFPSGLAGALRRIANEAQNVLDFEWASFNLSFRASISHMLLNVIIFSFILALLVSMPKWKDLMKTAAEHGKAWLNSISVSIQLVKTFFVAAIFVAITFIVVEAILIFIEIGSDFGDIFRYMGDSEAAILTVVLVAILSNFVFYTTSMLTGGTFDFNVTVRAYGERHSESLRDMFPDGNPMGDFTFFLLVIAGFLLAVYIFHKFIQKDDKYLLRGAFAVGFSTVFLSILSAMANISGSLTASVGYERMMESATTTFSMGTFTFLSVIKILLVTAAAFVLVYLSEKVPAIKNILDKFTGISVKFVYLFSALVTVVIALRVASLTGLL